MKSSLSSHRTHCSTQQVFPRSVVPIRPPRNVQPDDAWLFDLGESSRVPSTSVSTLCDATVPGRGPIRHRGRFRDECFAAVDGLAEFHSRKKHWRAALESLVGPRSRLSGPSLWITDDWSCGFFHWICDTLPRLLMTEHVLSTAEFTLLLPAKAARFPFIRESLRAFSLADIRVLSRFERVHCHELVLPSHAAPTGNYRPELMRELRRRFWNHIGYHPFEILREGSTQKLQQPNVENTNATDRFFLSRRDANRRRLVNESDLESVLRNHGFSSISAEDYSWHEQVELFSSASHLVSIHGAGLTNMVSMPPGGRVLEIRDRVEPTPNCYVNLASACDQDFYYSFSDRVDPSQCVHHGDVRIEPAELDRRLDQMVSDPKVSISFQRIEVSEEAHLENSTEISAD